MRVVPQLVDVSAALHRLELHGAVRAAECAAPSGAASAVLGARDTLGLGRPEQSGAVCAAAIAEVTAIDVRRRGVGGRVVCKHRPNASDVAASFAVAAREGAQSTTPHG